MVAWYNIVWRSTEQPAGTGVSDEDIRHAVANAVVSRGLDDHFVIIGADRTGRLLEVLARNNISHDLLVFHAMPLRPKYRRYLP